MVYLHQRIQIVRTLDIGYSIFSDKFLTCQETEGNIYLNWIDLNDVWMKLVLGKKFVGKLALGQVFLISKNFHFA
jgi:hypothetical protein